MTRTDDLLEPHEFELRDLLERTMTGTAVPTTIGPQALRHGRRLRTRRRVVGLAASAVPPARRHPDPARNSGWWPRPGIDPAGEPSARPRAAAGVAAPGDPRGWWSMPATDMVSTVEAILPDGVTVTSPGPLTAETEEGGPGAGFINAIVSGPAGPGRLNVILLPTIASRPHRAADRCRRDGPEMPSRAPDEATSLPRHLGAAPNAPSSARDGTVIGRRLSTTPVT